MALLQRIFFRSVRYKYHLCSIWHRISELLIFVCTINRRGWWGSTYLDSLWHTSIRLVFFWDIDAGKLYITIRPCSSFSCGSNNVRSQTFPYIHIQWLQYCHFMFPCKFKLITGTLNEPCYLSGGKYYPLNIPQNVKYFRNNINTVATAPQTVSWWSPKVQVWGAWPALGVRRR
jgi:hypothetical protein